MMRFSRNFHLRSLSFRAWVWRSNTRVNVRLFNSCFKTSRLFSLRQHSDRSAILDSNERHDRSNYKTFRRKLHSRTRSFVVRTRADSSRERMLRRTRRRMIAREQIWERALLFQQFHVLFNCQNDDSETIKKKKNTFSKT